MLQGLFNVLFSVSITCMSPQCLHPSQQMLWTKDLQMNTVNVLGVCRAVWHLCNNGNRGQVYHIVDNNNTSRRRTGEGITVVGCLIGVMKEGKGFVKEQEGKGIGNGRGIQIYKFLVYQILCLKWTCDMWQVSQGISKRYVETALKPDFSML